MGRPRTWTDDDLRRAVVEGSSREDPAQRATALLDPRGELDLLGHLWRGMPAPLRLDHINGDRRDNRLENLRAICPNCDAFTDTHCGRNIGRYDDDEDVP